MITTIDINKIKVNPNNPRLIKDDKFLKLVKSIQDFPQMLEIRPIVVNDQMIVLGGNMRLKACKEAGLKKVPVIKASQLTEDQQKEFIIKDNVGFGEWDWDLIANEWDTEQVTEWGLDIPDFVLQKEAIEDDYEIPDEIETDIVAGDLFEIGQHRLLCGDSTKSEDVAKLMNGQKADMVFTDPPYGVSVNQGSIEDLKVRNRRTDGKKVTNDNLTDNNLKDFLLLAFKSYSDSIKSGAAIYVCHAEGLGMDVIFRTAFSESGFKPAEIIIWVKDQFAFGRQDYHWRHEPIIYGWKEGGAHKFFGEKNQNTVWEIPRPKRSPEHPTMKPVELIARGINNSSKSDDIVIDFFLGSGTTMVAAHQLNRKCYGIEIDPKYCQVIIDRMKKLDPSLEIIKNGIKTEQYAV